jgi:hypothetical protein
MEATEDDYGKCLKCRKQWPKTNIVDGLCTSCLMEFQFCEDCESCEVPESGDVRFAKCTAVIRTDWLAVSRVTRGDNPENKHYYCTTERSTGGDQCENFKFNPGA